MKLHFFLFLPDTSILPELRSLNFSSTKENCDASIAPFNFRELKTNFQTILRSFKQCFDEKRTASLQKVEEQLFRIERKLDGLQNKRGRYEKRINMTSEKSNICWRTFQTNTYYFSHTEEKWERAREICADVDSYLLVINSKKEQDFVIQNIRYSTWLGLNDAKEEGTWRWVDGSPLEERFWRQGEPNNGGKDEDCAVLYKQGNWNDIHCDTRVSFICEREQVCVH
ncbi:hepatic lectin-like [Candoia aspera]|uniref:hepatic lectin-like n=1 Tax=Candoia aspera TaxID=51853 RepID=UPI002FD84611